MKPSRLHKREYFETSAENIPSVLGNANTKSRDIGVGAKREGEK